MTTTLHRLANGVRVVCDPMPGLETLALSVVAGRGARWEDERRSGWSHLLEHMVFKGAGSRSAREIVEAIEDQGGQLNAATGYERTSFQTRALKGGLPLAMEITADLLLRPTLDAGDLAREKQVVGQEIAEAADTPDDLVFELAQEKAFDGQSLGRPILGTNRSLKPATPQSMADWRAELYAPDRLVVSAAGAVDEAELLKLAEAAFGHLPARTDAEAPPPAAFTGGVAAKTRKLEQAHLVLLLPAVGAADDDYFVLRLFAEALGGGMSSRLFQEARENRGLAYAIDAYADTYADVGMLGVYAGCAAGDAAELTRITAGEIGALASSVTDAELRRAKAQLKGSLFMGREQPLNRAETAAGQTLLFDRLFTAGDIAEAIDAVTPADFARLGERLTRDRRSVVSVLGSKAALAAPEAFERALFP
ncbi:M16 family metallopeptidase [Caulobacter mirabilis]|uniref:Peptidase M16 n=1 Tax=Caulobacter mirabilis TaxID=69666 RepID=A0A2D2B206_9CAUL|nr:pitrilysin family protein [Caulobacter mirabilis]ATQ44237.1 peptidase M16 [Caulobacter mirabilis]